MTFDTIIADKPEAVQACARQLRQLFLEATPTPDENAYGGQKVQMTLYSIADVNNVAGGVTPAKDHVKLFLHHTDKVDTSGVKLQGRGKHAKHLKYTQVEDMPIDRLRQLIQEVMDVVAKRAVS